MSEHTNTPSSSVVSLLSSIVFTATAFLLPLFFIPGISNLFDGGKRFLLVISVGILFILFAVFSFLQKKITISLSPFSLVMGLLTVATILSIAIASPNKLASLHGNGLTYLLFGFLFLITTTLITTTIKNKIIWALTGAGVLLSLHAVMEKLGVGFATLLSSSHNLTSNDLSGVFPNGGSIINLTFLVIILVLCISMFFMHKSFLQKILFAISSSVLIVGILLNVLSVLPGKPQAPVMLSFQESWAIGLDILKNPKTAILGVGPDSYVEAYNVFRSVSANQSPYWFIRFGVAHNLPFDLLVTHGIVGLIAFVLLGVLLINKVRTMRRVDIPLAVPTVAAFVLLCIFPPSILLLAVFFILLITWTIESSSYSEPSTLTLLDQSGSTHKEKKILSHSIVSVISLALVLLAGAMILSYSRVVLASNAAFTAQKSLKENKAKESYDAYLKAIRLSPFTEEYHRAFSSLNFAIAQSLTQNKDLTDKDKETAINLIKQSISEAKIATALNQRNSTNWETLASVYQNLIGVVQKADQWSVAAYVQAINNNPSDPKLRLELASVFRKTKNLDQTVRLLQQAIELKPDYANAYFNLSDIAREQGNKITQLALLEKTLTLIPTTSPDYEAVKKQIDALRPEVDALKAQAADRQKQAAATASATQTQPTPTPAPVVSNEATRLATPSATPATQTELPLSDDQGIASSSAIPDIPRE